MRPHRSRQQRRHRISVTSLGPLIALFDNGTIGTADALADAATTNSPAIAKAIAVLRIANLSSCRSGATIAWEQPDGERVDCQEPRSVASRAAPSNRPGRVGCDQRDPGVAEEPPARLLGDEIAGEPARRLDDDRPDAVRGDVLQHGSEARPGPRP